jgi:hypothetical protein
MLTATNKRLLIFESRDDSNRCTPCRGNLIHMIRTLLMPVHVHHTYVFHEKSLYVVTFHANPTELDRFTTLEKKWSQLHLSAQLSGLWNPPQFLSQHNHWSSVLKPNICWWIGYIGLLGLYLQHVISTFNICSREPTHQSLIITGGGYNLGGVGLPHHTTQPSQPMWPAWSQVNQISTNNYQSLKFMEPKTILWSFDQMTIYCGLHLCLAKTIDLSLAIRSSM